MSRIYVDRISPYQSGSVQVDGLNLDTGSLTTKTEFNNYTSSNDSVVNALVAATSSLAGADWDTNLSNIPSGLVSGSDQLTGSLDSRYVNHTGNENISGRKTFGGNTIPIIVDNGELRVQGTSGNINVRFTDEITFRNSLIDSNNLAMLNAIDDIVPVFDWLHITNTTASFSEGVTNARGIYNCNLPMITFKDSTNLGNNEMSFYYPLIISSSVSIQDTLTVSGKVEMSNVLELAPLDPLPTGATGQLAVSGSNLYYHNGSSWSQIN